MNRMLLLLIAAVAVFSSMAGARILNVPDEYRTIQEGINDGSHGDTILVAPGTYSGPIYFNGHNVVLASHFLTSGDTSFISRTIITRNTSHVIITFRNGEDDRAALIGFTLEPDQIQPGTASGIQCLSSSPRIMHNVIRNINAVTGGGIYCSNSDPIIRHNTISGCYSYY